mmetsp:Transcript_43219/g.113518  ORF Transcript_43219/g.113518 Transcript_43219/m.113518 type:complete len:220 (-) Transcript_43219:15-674(-)
MPIWPINSCICAGSCIFWNISAVFADCSASCSGSLSTSARPGTASASPLRAGFSASCWRPCCNFSGSVNTDCISSIILAAMFCPSSEAKSCCISAIFSFITSGLFIISAISGLASASPLSIGLLASWLISPIDSIILAMSRPPAPPPIWFIRFSSPPEPASSPPMPTSSCWPVAETPAPPTRRGRSCAVTSGVHVSPRNNKHRIIILLACARARSRVPR